MRIGIGYDVHSLLKGRKMIIGGVEIKHTYGLEGHSDADVLLHAICDAILGSAGLKDIGNHFPNTDKKFKDISSITLLKECQKLISKKKLGINNIDSIVILEEPKINKYTDLMIKNISKALKIRAGNISIKATTSEGLGFIGAKKGAAAYAVCTLIEII